jgi:uncharacterized protein DUF4333
LRGPYTFQTPPRKRADRFVRLTVTLHTSARAIAAAAALTLAACGSSSSPSGLDTARVAHAIEASITAQRHVTAHVSCPTGIDLQAHLTFYCVAEVGARNTPFRVTERDASGHVRYAGVTAAPLLDTNAVATSIVRSIKAKKARRASVRCPSRIPRQKGLSFVCVASTTAGDTGFTVDQVDGAGHVTYRAR